MIEVKRLTQLGALGLAVAMSVPAMGIQRGQGRSNDKSNSNPNANSSSNSNANSNRGSSVQFPRGSGPKAGDWLRRNMNTPPAQQKQELEKSDDFKKLSPAQQQQLLQRLNRFNNMTPNQKNRVLSHMEWLDHLTPEQKQKANSLHQQFHSLSVDRRLAVRRALFGMRDMTQDERQKNIDSPQMKKDFNDQERELMKGYTSLGFPDQHAEEDNGGSPQQEM